ncbi:hypothetical protein AYO22_07968 [Fonsecaea multimorphosa]|nr:hypothetical protein AYO22_07968 [Fonsecaea multimorphosa]
MDTIHGSMSHRFMLLGLFALTQFDTARAGVSLDPVKNFCRRIGHSSVYKNGTLYINGGLETFVDFGANGQQDWSTITSGINENLISVDMTASWDWKTNVSISQNPREESGSVPGMKWPVNLHDGSLFGGLESSTTLYMFGGTTSSFNQSFPNFEVPPTTQYGLWTYDMDAQVWAAVDTSGSLETTPSWGANAEAPDQGLAFYVGGQIDSGTANTTQFLGNDTVGVGGMVILDTTSNSVTNVTVDDAVKSNRQGAGMVYVDNFGDAGVLVLIGGETQADGLLPMDEIWVFDINSTDLSDHPSSGKNMWYKQTATGDVPASGRVDFCLVAAPAQDNSSSNIYLYGGTSNGTIFDDVYVLSLPSFTWVKMITVGGGGKSSNITSDCDWEDKSLAVLDLSTIGWGSVFDAAAPHYDVPDDVVQAIGGGPAGNATKNQPTGGWAESGLSELFTIKKAATTTPAPKNSTTVTPPPTATPTDAQGKKSSGLSGGAIAGIAIAAVAGVAVVCGAIFFWLRSRRQHRQNAGMEIPEKDSLPSYSTVAAQNTPELGGTPQAAEMPAKLDPEVSNTAVQEPVEKDAGTVQGPHPSMRQNGPAEME